MSNTLWAKHHYAKCFGFWVVSELECVKCALSESCEKRTKAKVEEVDRSKDSDVDTEADGNVESEEVPVLSPLNYLIQSLAGKFDQETDEKENAILHKFRNNGRTVIAVAIGAYGKIKIVSVVKNTSKVFDKLESIDEVESVLKEML
jgi:hypothetical protein